MVKYLAKQIIRGELEYTYVVSKRPDLKEAIDEFLKENNRQDLITEVK